MFSFEILDRRITDFKNTLLKVFSSMPMVSARDLARCTAGKIVSMMPVIGSLAR